MYFKWECTCDCHRTRGNNSSYTGGCCNHCSRCDRNVKIEMEDLHNKNCKGVVVDVTPLSPAEQAVVDDARDLMEKVLVRIEQSTKQYGTNYVLANVMKETEDEILDIIGWPLLEAIRLRQLFLKKLGQLDGKYLDKFLEFQTFEYLSHLKEKINAELIKRQ
ncbi:hypothetical protein LCGC14_1919910 [marine sediment metagenome]|uniref:Uncharacterized protein n=1 Tax=marine sediment metagenome TaxID=412755 RepID=A0A0F9I531_9ZZZZ